MRLVLEWSDDGRRVSVRPRRSASLPIGAVPAPVPPIVCYTLVRERKSSGCSDPTPLSSTEAATGILRLPLSSPTSNMHEDAAGLHRFLFLVIIFLGISFLAVPQGSEPTRTLGSGKTVKEQIPAFDLHVYAVNLDAGQLLRFSVLPQKASLFVDMLAPDGSKIVGQWRESGAPSAPIEAVGTSNGSYRLPVRNESSSAGTYDIRVDELLTASEASARIAAQRDRAEAAARWVATNAIPLDTVEPGHGFRDLEPLKGLIGDARIVALGESTHGTREFFQLKHRVFEFLVREMGFTVLGMETTMPEAFDLNQYVLTGNGDPVKALSNTHYWVYDTEEVLDLIQWMRDYNADRAHPRKVRFYGFDMQFAARAAKVTLSYLRKVDPQEASAVERTLNLFSNPLAREDYALSKA